jgi:hypothetical protein
MIYLTGSIVIWWGRIEHLIFAELTQLRQHPAVEAAGVCDHVQIATKRMLAQWRKAAIIAAGADDELVSEIETLTADLRDLAEDRHLLVHSFWPYPTETAAEEVTLTILKPQGDGYLFLQTPVNLAKLTEAHQHAVALYHRVLQITLDRRFRMRRPKGASAPEGAILLAGLPLPTRAPASKPPRGAGS